jgi:type I restriction enzyme S subunit
VIPEFFYYITITSSFRRLGEQSMYGAAGQKRVPDDFIRDLSIPLPPLDEQHAIVAYLVEQTAIIDTLIDKARRAIDLLGEHRAALISAAVTGQIDVRGVASEETA